MYMHVYVHTHIFICHICFFKTVYVYTCMYIDIYVYINF